MADEPVFICVESRKGGVGKTTVALALASLLLEKPYSYEVLLVDLDITGTDVSSAMSNKFWNKKFYVVKTASNDESGGVQNLNIVDLFHSYMCGRDLPNVEWVSDSSKADVVSPNLRFVGGMVNLLPSFIARLSASVAPKYLPGVLFDEMHSIWFLELLRSLIINAYTRLEKASDTAKRRKLAVIFDNSPGYTGIQPALEDWLTDVGPNRSKFLFVSSADPQDISGTLDSTERIQAAINGKEAGARAFCKALNTPSEAINVRHNTVEEKIFSRLSSIVPDGAPCVDWLSSQESDGFCFDSCKTRCSRRCALEYYICCAKQTVTSNTMPKKFLSVLFNKVPLFQGVASEAVFEGANNGMYGQGISHAILTYDEMLARGYILSVVGELAKDKHDTPADLSGVAGDRCWSDLAKVMVGASKSAISDNKATITNRDLFSAAHEIMIYTVKWHTMVYEAIKQIAPNDEVHRIIWFEELSPIFSLLNLQQASITRFKAAKLDKLIKECEDRKPFAETALLVDAKRRLQDLVKENAQIVNEWQKNLNCSERAVNDYAMPLVFAACGLNGALSGTPPPPNSQTAPIMMRLVVLSQLAEVLDNAAACQEMLKIKVAERSEEQTAREKELLEIGRRIAGKRVRSSGTFDEVREAFCSWLVKVNSIQGAPTLFKAGRDALSADGSGKIIRSAVLREVLRQVLVTGDLTAEKGVTRIEEALSAVDILEVTKRWQNLAVLEEMKAKISCVISKWGLNDGAK